jgi:hypothetical protein
MQAGRVSFTTEHWKSTVHRNAGCGSLNREALEVDGPRSTVHGNADCDAGRPVSVVMGIGDSDSYRVGYRILETNAPDWIGMKQNAEDAS